jgi:ATP-dependent protease ClpP protease subunit
MNNPSGSRLVIGGQILLHGYVMAGGYEDEFSAREVIEALAQFAGGPVTVRINSIGGDAYEGAAIRAALAGHDGPVTVIIEGIAASAASLICCGAGRVEIAADASVMIHDPRAMAIGDSAEIGAAAATLDQVGALFAPIYAARLGIDAAAARALMIAETWWRGAEAVAIGFADALSDAPPPDAVTRMAAAAPLMMHAPGGVPKRTRAAAIAAGWIEGGPRAAKLKGCNMLPENIPPAAAVPAPLAPLLALDPAPIAPAPAPAPVRVMATAAAAAMSAAAVTMERGRISEIMEQGGALGISHSALAVMIADGIAGDAIAPAMQAAWMAQGTAPHAGARTPAAPRGGRRDEGDTMRAGMLGAMVARMSGARDVSGPAAGWMGSSVAEMAAAMTGHRGPLRTFSERSEVLMSALHTGSDFSGIVGDAMNRRLADVYGEIPPAYRAIAEEISFRDFRAHQTVSVGDLPDLVPVGSSGDLKGGTLGDRVETAFLQSYGVKFGIAREVMVNDDLGAIDRTIANYGRRVQAFEERTFWALALAAKLGDGVAVWHADRGNLAAVALSIDALSGARAVIRKTPGPDGQPINAAARFLVVGPDLETDAERLTSPISAVVSAAINPFAGRLDHLVTAEIPDGEFLVLADPRIAPAFAFGFLEGAAVPRIRVEQPFGQTGFGVSIEHDFGFGAMSAATYRSTGA